jgi:DNA repair exonuclease SbcCD nuclease subunit
VDEVVFCGDLFHTHGKIDAAVLKVAHEGMWRLAQHHAKPFHMYAIVGNHDTADKTMNTHTMHWLETVGWNVVDVPYSNRFNGLPCKLSLLPYTEDVEVIKQFFKDAADKADGAIYKGHEGGTVCFMHAGVDGVPMKSGFVPGSAFNTDMVPEEGIQHVFTGHYHPHNRVKGNITVVGTPLQLNWADEGDGRGFLVYDTDIDKLEFHSIAAPKFVTVDMSDDACGFGRGMQVQGNFIRVINYDEGDKEELREMFAGSARSVEFVVKAEEVDRLLPLSTDELHIPDIIKEYEEQQAVSPERSKVGEELRK